MYLAKIEILGFKSFAQKTRLKFNDGLSCIIGPNGSGKSNIVDAVRWVLGEQRVSSLRSDKMENVIFNGAKKRKPMGLAEVAMTIHNNKKILQTEFEEVVISRRLFRSGESQYLINNSPVRLKDVVDIFMDTGMGANSYSVIELKMVESMLSENRHERRQLFEEAAGVVKYKIRRRSALRKLDYTRTDLTRLQDIINEIEKNVRSLSRQVGKARRYLQYTDELKKLEIDLSRFRYHRLLDNIKPLQQQLQEVSKIKEESHHQITIDEALLEDYKNELINIEQELQKINKNLHEHDTRIAEINQQEAVAQTKTEEMKKARQRYLQEIEEFNRKISILDDNLQIYEQELLKLEEEKERIDGKYSSIEQERIIELEKLQNEKSEIDRLNTDFRSQLQALTQQKEQLKQNEYQRQIQNEQIPVITKEITTHDAAIAALKDRFKIAQKELDEKRSEINTLNADLNTEEHALALIKENLSKKESEKNNFIAELERLSSRENFYKQIISNYEGHAKSTRFIMKLKDKLPGIHGPASDLFSTEQKYTALVEIVLGNASDYVVVDDIKTAKEIISIVKKEDQGRITLIPLKETGLIPDVNPQRPSADFPLLSEFVKCDSQYRNIINLLLGDTAVVPSIDEALTASQQFDGFKFITEQGEFITANRGLSGGTVRRDASSSVIGRRDELKKYSAQIAEKSKELSRISAEIEEIKSEAGKCNQAQAKLAERIKANQSVLLELDKSESRIHYEINQHESGKQQKTDKLKQINSVLQQLSSAFTELEKNVESKQANLNQLEKETIQRTSEFDAKNEGFQLLQEEVRKAQLEASNIKNMVFNRRNDIERAKKTHLEHNEAITRRNQDIEQIDENLVQIKYDSEKCREEQVQIWKIRDEVETQREKIEHKYHENKDKIINLEDQAKKYRKQHNSSLERSRTLELNINENRFKSENIREFILKEYSEDIELGIPFDGLNEEESEDRIESLRGRIKHMGPVNPLAVSEYDKENGRLEFLSKQSADLKKAEESLIETIDKINKTAREQFLETFNAIKENFEKVFHSFFESGEGTISLDESEDPLESDIEVAVRTKGKRLQTLALLSGGEKTLTAISLLFAIYLVKPSPFCILDEVDAPLDDVNIRRFTEALKTFSDNTQFIVVTHNKRTMEAAETMYGVTMEEEGISKLVSVKFN